MCRHALQRWICGDLEDQLAVCQNVTTQLIKERDRAIDAYGQQLDRFNELQRRHTLMIEGPEPPSADRLRVLELEVLDRFLAETLGDVFIQCPCKLWSDASWLVTTKEELDRYLAYIGEYWLPHVKPYTVLEWERLSGESEEIAAVDCDDFEAFLKGITVPHGGDRRIWSALPWAGTWGEIDYLGGTAWHAFHFHVTFTEGFDETGPEGLEFWWLEPQTLDTWTEVEKGIARLVGEVVGVSRQPVPSWTYQVHQLRKFEV
jgi:hypothetical protein